jgi:phosphoribosylformylglycinamidine (FGAM) synthase-like amidotransferase family enzyme
MIVYEVKQEKGTWIGRRGRKIIKRSKWVHGVFHFVSDKAKFEAFKTGEDTVIRLHEATGQVREHHWTPKSARENIEAIRDICRRATQPADAT